MRDTVSCVAVILVCIPSGCTYTLLPDDGGPSAVAGSSAYASVSPAALMAGLDELPVPSTNGLISGDVGRSPDFRLYSLGPQVAGDSWSLTRTSWGSSTFVVVLFDQDLNLVNRAVLRSNASFSHIARDDMADLIVGVASTASSTGGRYTLDVTPLGVTSVPAPQPQLVYVSFQPANGLTVNNRGGISFNAFDAEMLGSAHAGQTAKIKELILAELRSDYAGHQVDFVSSDEGASPAAPHSVLYFGGEGAGLLGLADNVDNYNQDQTQSAIVFVDTFAIYWTMQLTDEQIAQMVANTASHELGHLLGLYHTAEPTDLMDTTAGAWELVADQDFGAPAVLDTGVFPVGQEDSPRLLAQTVGTRPVAVPEAKALTRQKPADRARVRALVQQELTCRCGNCINPDR